jgi:hypothetical protein
MEEGGAMGGAMAGVPESLAHLHDSAESNTYFPDPVRRRLREMLAAMWDAERELAVIAPRTALPHERRALTLLKEVQQASRVYVRKAGTEGAPLDPARRHTGKLEGVRDVAHSAAPAPPEPVVSAARQALAALGAEEVDGDGRPAEVHLDPGTVTTLRRALAGRARGGDAAALAALAALDAAATGGATNAAERATLLRALWELLPPPEAPGRRPAPRGELWERYQRALAEPG